MKYKQRTGFIVTVIVISLFIIYIHISLGINHHENENEHKINEQLNERNIHVEDNHQVTKATNHVTEASNHVIELRSDMKTTTTPQTPSSASDYTKPWRVWSNWVQSDVLFSNASFYSKDMNLILNAMSTYPITSFDVGYKGTQLKASMYLKGNQKTVFKPMRFSRDAIVDGPNDPCRGEDRHNGEIASFHLEAILGYRLAPPVVGRKINLTAIRSVTSEALLKTYLQKDGNTCFYGQCRYCKPSEAACADGVMMEGSVTLWLPDWYQMRTWRHPYQRTYVPNVKARWERDDQYCKTYLLKPDSQYFHLLPDIFDTMVLDFLVGNADRHHFETYSLLGKKGRLMHIDNGKSFGNPFHDEMSILTPLRQCCKLRNSTWTRLMYFRREGLSQILEKSLQRDPLYPIITPDHLIAIDRRVDKLIYEIQQCIDKYGKTEVLFNTWSEDSLTVKHQ